jgi:hypothetical protein
MDITMYMEKKRVLVARLMYSTASSKGTVGTSPGVLSTTPWLACGMRKPNNWHRVTSQCDVRMAGGVLACIDLRQIRLQHHRRAIAYIVNRLHSTTHTDKCMAAKSACTKLSSDRQQYLLK